MRVISIYNSYNNNNQEKREMLEHKLNKTPFETGKNGDVLVIIGGDGTFLSAVEKRFCEDPLFIGVNAGNVGFLSQFDFEEMDEMVNCLVKGEFDIEHVPLYEVEYIRDKNREISYFLNDFTAKAKGERVIHLNCSINNKDDIGIIGDGLILSSMVGSTGYNMSINGPVLYNNDQWVLTPLAPVPYSKIYQPIQWPLVLGKEDQFHIHNKGQKKRGFYLSCDSRRIEADPQSEITIRRSEKSIKLLRRKNYQRFNDIWEKLK